MRKTAALLRERAHRHLIADEQEPQRVGLIRVERPKEVFTTINAFRTFEDLF